MLAVWCLSVGLVVFVCVVWLLLDVVSGWLWLVGLGGFAGVVCGLGGLG